jgi:hypothetical protein
MAKLVFIKRPQQFDLWKRFTILIDDHKIGELTSAKESSFEIPNGKHTLQIKWSYIKSPIYSLELNNEHYFGVERNAMISKLNFAFRFTLILFNLVCISKIFQSNIYFNYFIWIYILLAITYLVYYILSGRKNDITMHNIVPNRS